MITKNILNQYIDIQKEIEEINKKIKRTEYEIAQIEKDGAVADSVSGGTGGTQHFRVEGFPYPKYSQKKNLLYIRKATQESLKIELEETQNEVEKFIATIEDSQIRRIINLKFIEKLTWRQVAIKIGGGNTEDSVRMIFNRYMKAKGAD